MYIWILYSIVTAICLSLYSINIKMTEKYISNDSFTFYFLFISFLILLVYNLLMKNKLSTSKWSVLAGLVQGIAVLMLNKSLSLASNPGLSMAVFSSQSMLTAIASTFVLGESISLIGMIGIILVISGVYIISMVKNKKENKKEKEDNNEWIYYSIMAAIFTSGKDLSTVFAIDFEKIKTNLFLLTQLGVSSLVAMIYRLYNKGNLELEYKENTKEADKRRGLKLLGSNIIIYLSFIIFVLLATITAPNPGYAKAINSFSIVLTIILSTLIFKGSEIDRDKWIGSLVIIAGVVILSIFG